MKGACPPSTCRRHLFVLGPLLRLHQHGSPSALPRELGTQLLTSKIKCDAMKETVFPGVLHATQVTRLAARRIQDRSEHNPSVSFPQDVPALGLQAEPCPGGGLPAGCWRGQADPHGHRGAGCTVNFETRHPQDFGRYCSCLKSTLEFVVFFHPDQ